MLFTGRRSFPKRLLLALFPSLALSFTLFFFGPLDLSYVSRRDVTYSPLAILPQTLLVMGITFIALLLLAAIPGGKIHAFLVSVYTGILTAMYVQGAFLNPNFGTLDGHSINWPSFSTMMLINLFIWFCILLVPHILHYFSNRVWRFFVILISVVLVLMQSVSLTIKLIDQAEYDRSRKSNYYISNENLLKVGKKNNIVVFLLDTVSNSDLNAMLEKYPDSLDLLHDFTRYDNANTHYMFTVPSVVSLLTGAEWECDQVGISDYMRDAWKSDTAVSFYSTLKELNYERNIFIKTPKATSDPSVLSGIFSNLKFSNEDYQIDRTAFLKLFKLSFYRYFPLALKPFFVIYSSDITNLITRQDAMESGWDFVIRFNEETLSNGNFDNNFTFYHLMGTHLPYRMDERGRLINSNLAPEYFTNYSEMEDQAAGFFFLISEYIRQLKEMGLYDRTGIIILADHGNNQDKSADHQPIYLIKRPGDYNDKIVLNSAPITIHDCFMADVMQMIGNEDWTYGIPSNEVPDEPTERWTRAYAKDSNYPLLPGSAYNVMREYRFTGDGDWLIERWISGVFDTYPMLESYY